MPYKDRGKWRGVVKIDGKRFTKSFQKKSDAGTWEHDFKKSHEKYIEEAKKRASLKIISLNDKKHSESFISEDLSQLKKKYRALYFDSPHNTIPDIFDSIMEEIGIPVSFKQVLDLARSSIHRDKERVSAKLRAEIFKRDNFTCQWCGRTPPDAILQVDHIVPKSRGGLTEFRNLETKCQECNLGKSDLPHLVKK